MNIQSIGQELLTEIRPAPEIPAGQDQSLRTATEKGKNGTDVRLPERMPVVKEGEAPDRRETGQIVEQLNKLMTMFDKSVRFAVEDGENDFQVRIIDRRTDKVLKEYPPEELVNVIERIRDAVGLVIDEKI